MNAEVLATINRGDAVPSMPNIVTRFLDVTRNPNYNIADAVNLLSTDAGIAGGVLRLANSPLFGVTRKISSLIHAANLLGMKRVRTLVMGRCMVDRVNENTCVLIDRSYFWRRSLATGVLAARLAEQVAPQQREEAFMCGLLSDVGVTVLAQAMPDRYAAIAEHYAPRSTTDLLEMERRTLGTAHPEVSALVLERWSLPETMVGAVRYHHDTEPPDDLPQTARTLALVVGRAAAIARLLCEAPDEFDTLPTCEQAMATLGLDLATLTAILRSIETDINEFATLLRIDVIPSQVYKIIADSIAERLAIA